MMKKYFCLCLLLTLMVSCAKIVTPVGGPKDTTPPVVTKEVPANHSTNFNSKNIKISFNEFVVLNNPNKTVIVSPPLAETPELETVNKSVVIKLPDSLKPNTTYSIVLAETIKDFTEGNPLSLYEYTFSTGSTIDSFMMKGVVTDALTLSKVKDILVLLYTDDIDSLPLTTRPAHITKTLNNGEFIFNNIKPGKYKIFALDDINNNLIYDLPNEKIAFCDSLVSSWAMPLPADTSKKDSTSIISTDTSAKVNHPKIELTLFTERDTNQAMLKYINNSEYIYQFPYKTDFKDFSARHIGGQELDYFQFISKTNDTVTWYLKEALADTALYEFTTDQTHIDSVKITKFQKKNKQQTGRGKKEDDAKLNVSFSNKENIFKPLTIQFSYPIKPTGSFDIKIIKTMKSGNDTVVRTCTIPDGFVTSIPIGFSFEPKMQYAITIRDSVFFGYDGTSNDSIKASFTTKSEKDYGNFLMHYHIIDNSCPYIVQFLNKSGNIIQEDILNTGKSIEYAHLDPGSYKIKVIKDKNGNGKWDTGCYRDKTQPEPIFFFEKSINIRGYWDIEEDFDLR